jgi:hypothetical protein
LHCVVPVKIMVFLPSSFFKFSSLLSLLIQTIWR